MADELCSAVINTSAMEPIYLLLYENKSVGGVSGQSQDECLL